jgi:hypothetical protein
MLIPNFITRINSLNTFLLYHLAIIIIQDILVFTGTDLTIIKMFWEMHLVSSVQMTHYYVTMLHG